MLSRKGERSCTVSVSHAICTPKIYHISKNIRRCYSKCTVHFEMEYKNNTFAWVELTMVRDSHEKNWHSHTDFPFRAMSCCLHVSCSMSSRLCPHVSCRFRTYLNNLCFPWRNPSIFSFLSTQQTNLSKCFPFLFPTNPFDGTPFLTPSSSPLSERTILSVF